MISRIALVILTAFLFVGCQGHRSLPKEQWTVTEVHEVPGQEKVAIYTAARAWFAHTFRDSKSVLEVQDKDAGQLIGKGYIPKVLDWGLGASASLHFGITIDVKDGKYRIVIEALNFLTSTGTEREVIGESELKAVMSAMKQLDADLLSKIAVKKTDF